MVKAKSISWTDELLSTLQWETPGGLNYEARQICIPVGPKSEFEPAMSVTLKFEERERIGVALFSEVDGNAIRAMAKAAGRAAGQMFPISIPKGVKRGR